MSEYRNPVTFGPLRKTMVAVAAVILLSSVGLQLSTGEFSWESSLTSVAGLGLMMSQYLGWRGEQRLERERIARRHQGRG